MSSNNTANSRDKSEEAESEEAVSLAKKDTVPVTPDAEKADNQVPRPFPSPIGDGDIDHKDYVSRLKLKRIINPFHISISKENNNREEVLTQRLKQENNLRRILAYWSLILVTIQVIATNACMVFYFFYESLHSRLINPTIATAWLSTDFVEIVGILWVITRSLFPFNDRPSSAGKHNQ